MNFSDIFETLQLDIPPFNLPQLSTIPHPLFFLLSVLLSLLVGRYTPGIVRLILHRFFPERVAQIYENVVEPNKGTFRFAGTIILISLSRAWLGNRYQSLQDFFDPFINLLVIGSVAWLVSGVFRQVVRIYGVALMKKLGRDVDEMLLVMETVANVAIGFVAVLAFAQSQNFNLIGLMASLGIGGLAIAFAAQKILEQLLSTVVLYLDRPFIPGEYIRLSSGQLGRVESIGLRSTKIRASGKNTLIIVPNSTLIGTDIENVTRAKKVMVLLYLDFVNSLDEQETAVVEQAISESTDSVFGIDPGSTNISFSSNNGKGQNRARVSFFILGSNENSIQLRKRLLESANETLSKKLLDYGIEFSMNEPTIYVESPVTI